MVQTLVGDVEVEFPFEPYACQTAYMEKVIQALNMKCDAALESPTGTGKTLSLLCSTLAWIQKQKTIFTPTLQQVIAVSNEAKGAPTRNLLVPRIYYSSRTHSQLTQVVRELNKTVYKNIPISFLASRQRLCIHEKVKLEPDNQVKSVMCRSLVNKHSCYYYNQLDKCNSETLTEIYGSSGNALDIEEIVNIAKQHKHCPFFRARQMSENAELILLPYNYLIDPQLRRRYDVDLKGSVVIFDEAHNLESICEESISVEISTVGIALAARELKKAIDVLQEKTEEIRTELDLGNQAFSTGVVEAAKQTAKEEPAFEIGVAYRIIEMLCEFEKYIYEAYEDSANFKAFQEFPGRVYAGTYLLEVLEKAQFGYDKAAEISNILSKAADLLHDEAEGAISDQGNHLRKLNTFLTTVYCSHTKDMAEAVSETKTIQYDNQNIIDKFKLYLEKIEKESEDPTIVIKYWCFSASLSMKLLKAQGARTIIVTSGTLSPLQNFMDNIGLDFGCKLENIHAAQSSQVLTAVIKRAPGQTELLSGSFKNRGNQEYYTGVGEVLLNLTKEVPQGILVFFSSYGLMKQTITMLRTNGSPCYWDRIRALKPIVVEPEQQNQLDSVRCQFESAVQQENGALFFAVCRGKVSEGIDFADSSSRAVVIVGIPYPPIYNPRVMLKKLYLLEQRLKDSNATHPDVWYQNEGFRAVNQAIGRVLRHINDFGTVVLLDSRFASTNITNFPSWLRPSLKIVEKYEYFHKRLISFFGERSSEVNASKRSALENLISQSRMNKKQSKRRRKITIEEEPLQFRSDSEISEKISHVDVTHATSLKNLDEAQTSTSNSFIVNKQQELVPSNFGSVCLSTTIPAPGRKKVKLLRKTPFLQKEDSSRNLTSSEKAFDTDNAVEASIAGSVPHHMNLPERQRPMKRKDNEKEETKSPNLILEGKQLVSKDMSESDMVRRQKKLKLSHSEDPVITQTNPKFHNENLNKTARELSLANQSPNKSNEPFEKKNEKVVIMRGEKLPIGQELSSEVKKRPSTREAAQALPKHFDTALAMDQVAFAKLMKETGLAKDFASVLKGMRDKDTFERSFESAKSILLPKHPNLFVAMAKFLNPSRKKIVLNYALSKKLEF